MTKTLSDPAEDLLNRVCSCSLFQLHLVYSDSGGGGGGGEDFSGEIRFRAEYEEVEGAHMRNT